MSECSSPSSSFQNTSHEISDLFAHFFQQRIRESREARRALLRDEHRFIMNIVSMRLEIDVSAVEEFVINSNEVPKTSLYWTKIDSYRVQCSRSSNAHNVLTHVVNVGQH